MDLLFRPSLKKRNSHQCCKNSFNIRTFIEQDNWTHRFQILNASQLASGFWLSLSMKPSCSIEQILIRAIEKHLLYVCATLRVNRSIPSRDSIFRLLKNVVPTRIALKFGVHVSKEFGAISCNFANFSNFIVILYNYLPETSKCKKNVKTWYFIYLGTGYAHRTIHGNFDSVLLRKLRIK